MKQTDVFAIEGTWADAWCSPMDPSREEGERVFIVRARDEEQAEAAVLDELSMTCGAGFSVRATAVDPTGFDLTAIDIDCIDYDELEEAA